MSRDATRGEKEKKEKKKGKAEGNSHRRSHLPPIFDHGTSPVRAQEHSTTAAPYCSINCLSVGESRLLAMGLY